MKQIIVAQPNLKCCGNCKKFCEGMGGCHKCLHGFQSGHESTTHVRETDICNLFEE